MTQWIQPYSNLILLQASGLTTSDKLTATGVAITIISILVWGIYKWGRITQILDDFKPLVNKIPSLEAKVDALWKEKYTESNSPMQLNDKGKQILEQSGIKEVIRRKKNDIVKAVKAKNPENAYRAQSIIIDVVKELKEKPDCIPFLEKGAFESGADVEIILFVGAVFIRDEVLKELNFNKEDIDKHDPTMKGN